jgi:6-phosphofructokinase 1
MKERNLLVVQGGGPTQVLNATLAAVVDEARMSGSFGRILGASSGMRGLAGGRAVDLSALSHVELDLLRVTPGAFLGSSRYKPSREKLARAGDRLDRRGVHDVLFIGGNGTMCGAEAFSRSCREAGCEIRVIGIPKTVDNDIEATDRCPGYGSAARYIAQSTRELGTDVRSLPQPVSILETLGRSVGWVAAASVLAKRDEADAPHLVYIPEKPFEMERFLGNLDTAVAKLGWAVVVVAEGIRDARGRFVYQVEDLAQADALNRPLTGGVAQFLAATVARRLGLRCRSEKPGLLGRSSIAHTSKQDLQDAKRVGRAGVLGLLEGVTDKMVALRALTDLNEPGYDYVSLKRVAMVERSIPPKWLDNTATAVNFEFLQYLQPIVGELAPFYASCSMKADFVEIDKNAESPGMHGTRSREDGSR